MIVAKPVQSFMNHVHLNVPVALVTLPPTPNTHFCMVFFEKPGFPWKIIFLVEGRHATSKNEGIGCKGYTFFLSGLANCLPQLFVYHQHRLIQTSLLEGGPSF